MRQYPYKQFLFVLQASKVVAVWGVFVTAAITLSFFIDLFEKTGNYPKFVILILIFFFMFNFATWKIANHLIPKVKSKIPNE